MKSDKYEKVSLVFFTSDTVFEIVVDYSTAMQLKKSINKEKGKPLAERKIRVFNNTKYIIEETTGIGTDIRTDEAYIQIWLADEFGNPLKMEDDKFLM